MRDRRGEEGEEGERNHIYMKQKGRQSQKAEH